MFGRNASALLISTIVHIALLGAMAFYKISMDNQPPVVAVETVIADERDQQQFEARSQLGHFRIRQSFSPVRWNGHHCNWFRSGSPHCTNKN